MSSLVDVVLFSFSFASIEDFLFLQHKKYVAKTAIITPHTTPTTIPIIIPVFDDVGGEIVEELDDVSYFIGVAPDERTCIPAKLDPTAIELSKFFFVLSIADALLADIVPSTFIEPLLIFVICKKFSFWPALTPGSLIKLTNADLNSFIFEVKVARSRFSSIVKLNWFLGMHVLDVERANPLAQLVQ